MPQSSLTTWLSKPSAVTEPPPVLLRHEKNNISIAQLPTPPPVEDERVPPQKAAVSLSENERLFSHQTPPLPSNIHLRAPTREDITSLKRLNNLLLPIPYPESFYREIATDPLTQSLTLLAYWHDDPTLKDEEKGRLIGAIRCRLLARPPEATPDPHHQPAKGHPDDAPMLYLSTLVLLSPYRSQGVAAHMLAILLRRAVHEHGVRSVGAHVWEANPEGLEWYRKRGFREVGTIDGYYRKLKPQTAVLVRREVSVRDLLGEAGTNDMG